MVQVTSILLAVIIMIIIILAVLVILSGTVPAFKDAVDAMRTLLPGAKPT